MTCARFGKFKAQFSEVFWLWLLAGIVLIVSWMSVDRVIGRTQSSLPAFVERVTNISMVNRAGSGLVLNSGNNNYNSVILGNQPPIRNGHIPLGQEANHAFFIHFIWDTRGDRDAIHRDLGLEWYKPFFGLLKSTEAHKNIPSHHRIQSNRFAIVDKSQLAFDRLINQATTRLYNRNNVRAIGLAELFPAQIQGIDGTFCKLFGRFENFVSLDAVVAHFIELFAHKIPLSASNDCGNHCTHRNNSRESKFPLVTLIDTPFSLKKFSKLLYFFACLYVSMYFWRETFSSNRRRVMWFATAFVLMIGHGTLILLFA